MPALCLTVWWWLWLGLFLSGSGVFWAQGPREMQVCVLRTQEPCLMCVLLGVVPYPRTFSKTVQAD